MTLYGTTNASSVFMVIRSWNSEVLIGNSTEGEEGILFQENGLAYGSYTVALTISEGTVTVSSATVITGMGPLGSVPFVCLETLSDINMRAVLSLRLRINLLSRAPARAR